MIEAMTYRTRSSLDRGRSVAIQISIRIAKVVKERYPIDFLRNLLVEEKLWNDSAEKELLGNGYEKMIASRSIQRARSNAGLLDPKELIFSDVYSKEPWFLKEEREESE